MTREELEKFYVEELHFVEKQGTLVKMTGEELLLVICNRNVQMMQLSDRNGDRQYFSPIDKVKLSEDGNSLDFPLNLYRKEMTDILGLGGWAVCYSKEGLIAINLDTGKEVLLEKSLDSMDGDEKIGSIRARWRKLIEEAE